MIKISTPQKKQRVFFVIDLSTSFRRSIIQFILKLKKQYSAPSIKWVNPENCHLTIVFLGELDPQQIATIDLLFSQASKNISEFTIEISELEYFKTKTNTGILALHIALNDHILNLEKTLKNILLNNNFHVDSRKFKLHITLARIKNATHEMSSFNHSAFKKKVIVAKSISLYQSVLTKEGAIYRALRSWQLKS